MTTIKRTGTHLSKLITTIFGLAILASLTAQPASATIYQFAIPVSSLLTAITSAVPSAPDKYAFYDVFIRASDPTDGGVGVFMTSPYNVNGTPYNTPAPSVDAWTDVVNGTNTYNDGIFAPGDGFLSIHFTAAAGITRNPLLTTNTAAITNTKVIDGKIAENINTTYPNATFMVFISSPGSYVGQAVQLEFYAVAYKFNDVAWSGATPTKGSVFSGNFTEVAQLTPEPISVVMTGGGMLLLAIAGIRRKRHIK
ncbi:MAG: hypothetical protein ABI759_17895 [Candidatus Solibacter sp.]